MQKAFRRNVIRRYKAVQTVLAPALKRGVDTRKKSAYFRAAIVIFCSVVEGLAYELVEKHAPGGVIGKKVLEKTVGTINESPPEIPHQLLLVKKVKSGANILLDERVGFDALNNYLLNKKLINKKEFRTLNSIKDERNRIHIQGISGNDILYTQVKVERLGRAADFLIRKILKKP